MEKVSVIIPVYNVEKYIESVLRSIVNQTYGNIEIIVVNDGSTDDSETVARKILEKSGKEFKIITKDNGGVSSARNQGIKLAAGDWVIAVDGDDCLDFNAIENMVRAGMISDVVFTNYRIVTGFEEQIIEKFSVKSYTGEEAARKFYERKIKLFSPGCFVRKSFLEDNLIEYDEDCYFAEDDLFVWKVLSKMDKMVLLQEPVYQYVFHSNSSMTSGNWKRFASVKTPSRRTYERFIECSYNMRKIKNEFLIRHFSGCLHAAALVLNYEEFLQLYRAIDYAEVYRTSNVKGIKGKILPMMLFYTPHSIYKFFRKLNGVRT
ncbi:glycosyltransferase family A protein [Lachnospiraceae bacterium 48-21]